MKLTRLLLTFVIVTIGLSLWGCATTPDYSIVFFRTNSSPGDLNKDKYECLQESMQPRSYATGGYCIGYYCQPYQSRSSVELNELVFFACMAARGWGYHKEMLDQQSQQQPNVPAPGSAEDWVSKAKSMCSSSNCTNPQKAIEFLNEAIRLKPDFASAYHDRGIAHYYLKQFELAANDFSEAIRLKPHEIPYCSRGNLYSNLKQHQLAIKDFDEAIRLKPDMADAHAGRGLAYISITNTKEGCRSLNRACELGSCIEVARQGNYCQPTAQRGLECRKMYEEKKAEIMEIERRLKRNKDRLTRNIYDKATQWQKEVEYAEKIGAYKQLISDANAEVNKACK